MSRWNIGRPTLDDGVVLFQFTAWGGNVATLVGVCDGSHMRSTETGEILSKADDVLRWIKIKIVTEWVSMG